MINVNPLKRGILVHNTAILFFSRSASCEAVAKPYLKASLKSNTQIAKSLISNSLATLNKTALPFYLLDEKKQEGNTFNDKLLNAITYGFDKGHEKLIVVGNDCPQLTAKDILIAAEKLNNNDFVIGPTYTGGLYLIGLTKNADFHNFIPNVAWQTDTVVERTLSFLHETAVAYFLLPTLSDFNDINDYTFLKHRLTVYNLFLKVIKSIIASHHSPLYPSPVNFINCVHLSSLQLRGPPFFR